MTRYPAAYPGNLTRNIRKTGHPALPGILSCRVKLTLGCCTGLALVLTGMLLAVPPVAAQSPSPTQGTDALDETLALVGLQRQDLGWIPKGWWPRFPEVPYKLRAFDAIFAEPLDGVSFTRALGQTAWDKLDPAHRDDKAARGSGQLYQAVQQLGVDPMFGGFRGYSANVVAPKVPLSEAVLQLIQAAGRPSEFVTFGTASPYPQIQGDLASLTAPLPASVDSCLGQLVLNVVDAYRWAELAFRRVDGNDRQVVARRFNLGEELIDALDYCPEVDDVALTLDEASLWYAGMKCTEALDEARIALTKARFTDVPGDYTFDWETPWGWIRVRGGDNNQIEGHDLLLAVDLGGNDSYRGGVAASTAARPVGLVLDMSGDDTYQSQVPAQGAGICGVGILLDVTGNDSYSAHHYSQGAGQFGLGVCADLGGDDEYSNHYSGQGCGYFGIGLLLDAAGKDAYTLWAEGQGFGGGHGVGVLADRTGDDRYVAVRQHTVTDRPSYHSPEQDVSVSNAQGCGMGRRGDGADGHSWAGGLGALLDGEGNDYYSAGNWSMGTGYWFGIGVLHDRGGDDEYHGVAWSQGSGAHFCIGVMVDEGGNDQHLSEENSVLSLGMAHDFTVGLLVDLGGDDLYSVDGSGLGQSLNRSVAMLIDVGGDDTYQTAQIPRPGRAVNSESFRARGGVATYFADTTSLGLFLDIGGQDSYWADLQNDTHWLDPPEDPNWVDRNFSVGVDRAAGQVHFTPRPVKVPSGR